MNTKKIWIFAVLFGLLMSILFFILTLEDDQGEVDPVPIEDEPIVESNDLENGLLDIQPGKRAMTIAVDDIQSVTGFIQPGSYVDVVSVLDDGVAQIILQKVRVLAVGTITENTEMEEENTMPAYDKVTLELDPNAGPLLSLARARGILTLMLRAQEDETETSPVTISLEQLTRGQTAK